MRPPRPGRLRQEQARSRQDAMTWQRLRSVDPAIGSQRRTGDFANGIRCYSDPLVNAGSEVTTSVAIEQVVPNAHRYRNIALKRLVEKGVLREDQGRFLWVF